MRTGSNLLETHLNENLDILCLGEAFNPSFIGYPNRSALLEISQKERDRDPMQLLQSAIIILKSQDFAFSTITIHGFWQLFYPTQSVQKSF